MRVLTVLLLAIVVNSSGGTLESSCEHHRSIVNRCTDALTTTLSRSGNGTRECKKNIVKLLCMAEHGHCQTSHPEYETFLVQPCRSLCVRTYDHCQQYLPEFFVTLGETGHKMDCETGFTDGDMCVSSLSSHGNINCYNEATVDSVAECLRTLTEDGVDSKKRVMSTQQRAAAKELEEGTECAYANNAIVFEQCKRLSKKGATCGTGELRLYWSFRNNKCQQTSGRLTTTEGETKLNLFETEQECLDTCPLIRPTCEVFTGDLTSDEDKPNKYLGWAPTQTTSSSGDSFITCKPVTSNIGNPTGRHFFSSRKTCADECHQCTSTCIDKTSTQCARKGQVLVDKKMIGKCACSICRQPTCGNVNSVIEELQIGDEHQFMELGWAMQQETEDSPRTCVLVKGTTLLPLVKLGRTLFTSQEACEKACTDLTPCSTSHLIGELDDSTLERGGTHSEHTCCKCPLFGENTLQCERTCQNPACPAGTRLVPPAKGEPCECAQCLAPTCNALDYVVFSTDYDSRQILRLVPDASVKLILGWGNLFGTCQRIVGNSMHMLRHDGTGLFTTRCGCQAECKPEGDEVRVEAPTCEDMKDISFSANGPSLGYVVRNGICTEVKGAPPTCSMGFFASKLACNKACFACEDWGKRTDLNVKSELGTSKRLALGFLVWDGGCKSIKGTERANYWFYDSKDICTESCYTDVKLNVQLVAATDPCPRLKEEVRDQLDSKIKVCKASQEGGTWKVLLRVATIKKHVARVEYALHTLISNMKDVQEVSAVDRNEDAIIVGGGGGKLFVSDPILKDVPHRCLGLVAGACPPCATVNERVVYHRDCTCGCEYICLDRGTQADRETIAVQREGSVGVPDTYYVFNSNKNQCVGVKAVATPGFYADEDMCNSICKPKGCPPRFGGSSGSDASELIEIGGKDSCCTCNSWGKWDCTPKDCPAQPTKWDCAAKKTADGEVGRYKVEGDTDECVCNTCVEKPTNGFTASFVDEQTGEVDMDAWVMFLGTQPFSVSYITTGSSSSSDIATLTGKDAITVVFNRAVIALGSNFGDNGEPGESGLERVRVKAEIAPDDEGVIPLLWDCGNGLEEQPPQHMRVRWVTTTILRYDTTGNWVTDLRCTVMVNPKLRSWDGKQIDKESVDEHAISFKTTTLEMHVVAVKSRLSSQYTDGAFTGSNGEVPPDGILQFNFRTQSGSRSWQKRDIDFPLDESMVKSTLYFTELDTKGSPLKDAERHHLEQYISKVEGKNYHEWQIDFRAYQLDHGEFPIGSRFAVMLPRGAKLAEGVGETTTEFRIEFTGLLSFVISRQSHRGYLRSRNIRFAVAHGIMRSDNEAERRSLEMKLENQFHWVINGKSHSNSQLNARVTHLSQVQFNMYVELPTDAIGSTIVLIVEGSDALRDNWDVPLSPSEHDFTLQDVHSALVSFPGEHVLFDPKKELSVYSVIHRPKLINDLSNSYGCTGTRLHVVPIGVEQVISMMTTVLRSSNGLAYYSARECQNMYKQYSPTAVTVGESSCTSKNCPIERASIHTDAIFQATGLAAAVVESGYRAAIDRKCTRENPHFQCSVWSRSTYGIVATEYGGKVWTMVVNMQDNSPVESATVYYYYLGTGNTPMQGRRQSDQATQSTDSLGVHTMDISGELQKYKTSYDLSQRWVVLAEKNGQWAYTVFTVAVGTVSCVQPSWSGELLTERSMYLPGETVHIKGYARWKSEHISEDDYTQSGKPLMVQVATAWDTTVVAIDPHYHSWDADITIPDTEYGPQTVNAHIMKQNSKGKTDYFSVGYLSFVSADPRIPTGELVFEKSEDHDVYKPSDKSIRVNIQTNTNLGAPAVSQTVTLTIRISLQRMDKANSQTVPEDIADTIDIPLDDGVLNDFEVHLDQMIDPGTFGADDSGTVTVTAEWFTATRDKLTETIVYSVRASLISGSWKLEDRYGGDTHLPGYKLTYEHTVDNPQNVQYSIKYVKLVEMSNQYAVPTVEEIESAEGFDFVGSTSDPNTITADIKLPSMGNYVLVCVFNELEGVPLFSYAHVGKTLKQWQHAPLTSFNAAAPTVESEYNPTQDPTGEISVSWVAPFNAKLMMIWHNNDRTDPKCGGKPMANVQQLDNMIDVVQQDEPTTFKVKLGSECTPSCKISFIALVEESQDVVLPVSVPLGQGMDLNIAQCLTWAVTVQAVEAKQEENFNLSVDIKLAESAVTNEAVVRPGASSEMDITVTYEDSEEPVANAEVTVWVVDKATHDLGSNNNAVEEHTYSVQGQIDLKPSSSSYYCYQCFTLATNYQLLTTPHILGTVQRSMEYRAARDPWSVYQHSDVTATSVGTLDIDNNLWLGCQYSSLQRPSGLSFSDIPCVDQGGEYFPRYGYNYGPVFGGGDYDVEESAAFGDVAMSAPDMAGGAAPEMAMDRSTADDGAAEKSSGNGAATGAGRKVDGAIIRSGFEVTPLFHATLKTDSNGKLRLPWDVPSNVGTWIVKASVTDQEFRFGSARTDIVARRNISMDPSWPRIVRIGDSFKAGVSVTLTEGEVPVGVKVIFNNLANVENGDLDPSIVLKSASTEIPLILQPFEPQEVVFDLEAIGVGNAAATIVVQAAGEIVDGFEHEVESLGLQPLVYTATSFSITATTQGTEWQEGLPSAEPQSAFLDITAGVGRFLSVKAIAEEEIAVIEDHLLHAKHKYSDTLLRAFTPVGILPQFSPLNENAKALLKRFTDIIPTVWRHLKENTVSGYGLQSSSYYYNPYISVNRNLWALFIHKYTTQMVEEPEIAKALSDIYTMVPSPVDEEPSLIHLEESHKFHQQGMEPMLGKLHLNDMSTTDEWHDAVIEGFRAYHIKYDQCVAKYSDNKDYSCPEGWLNDLAFAYYVLGIRFPLAKECCSTSPAHDKFSFDYLIKSMDKLSDQGSVFVALTIASPCDTCPTVTQPMNDYREVFEAVDKEIFNLIRVPGRYAYVSERGGGDRAQGMTANALALVLFQYVQERKTDTLVEKLANYVAGAGRETGRNHYVYSSGAANTWKMIGLTLYDSTRDSTSPDLTLTVPYLYNPCKGNKCMFPEGGYLVNSRFTSPSQDAVVVKDIPWAVLGDASKPNPITFTATGKGEASIVLGMEFSPKTLNKNPVYFGLFIEKKLAVINPDGSTTEWNHKMHLVPGQSVEVTIQVTTPDDLRGGVMLEDYLPGCIEAIDPNVVDEPYTEQDNNCAFSKKFQREGVASEGVAVRGGASIGGFAGEDMMWEEPMQQPCESVPFGRGGADYSRFVPWLPPIRWDFPLMDYHKDKVTCFTNFLSAGSHTCTYKANVVTTGAFNLPPTKGYAVEQPELMGLSNTDKITVSDRQK